MSLILIPTKYNRVADLLCTFDFRGSIAGVHGREQPTIVGWKPSSPEDELAFLTMPGERLKDGPRDISPEWERHGFAANFSGSQRTGKVEVTTGAGLGTSSFAVQPNDMADTTSGSVITIPICLLLDFAGAFPQELAFDVRIQGKVKRRMASWTLPCCKRSWWSSRAFGRRMSDISLPVQMHCSQLRVSQPPAFDQFRHW